MVTRFGTPIALLIALTVLLAACGGDSVDTPLDDGMLGDDTTADTGGDDVDDGNDAGPPAPIGLRIAFVSERDGNPEIYVMSAPEGTQGTSPSTRRRTRTPPGRLTVVVSHSDLIVTATARST